MKNEQKKHTVFIILFVILNVIAYLFSELTDYSSADSLLIFVVLPLMILSTLVMHVPKIWKMITVLLVFVVLYFALVSSPDLRNIKLAFFIFLIIYIFAITYFSERNRIRNQ